jgi:hypothetical protein
VSVSGTGPQSPPLGKRGQQNGVGELAAVLLVSDEGDAPVGQSNHQADRPANRWELVRHRGGWGGMLSGC